VKALTARLPPPLPGGDSEPLAFELPDETGASVSLERLAGHLVIVSSLPLANATASADTLSGLFRLRKHLRGLDKSVAFVLLCRGSDAAALSALLDQRKARKPLNLFLLDAGGEEFARLCRQAGSPAAEWLLLDRHARVRGVYGGDSAALEKLVLETGLLANWAGQDGPLR
jgi:hypothetical protein